MSFICTHRNINMQFCHCLNLFTFNSKWGVYIWFGKLWTIIYSNLSSLISFRSVERIKPIGLYCFSVYWLDEEVRLIRIVNSWCDQHWHIMSHFSLSPDCEQCICPHIRLTAWIVCQQNIHYTHTMSLSTELSQSGEKNICNDPKLIQIMRLSNFTASIFPSAFALSLYLQSCFGIFKFDIEIWILWLFFLQAKNLNNFCRKFDRIYSSI